MISNREEVTGSLEKLTSEECLVRLETLFKAYRNDSEFNYQLSSPMSAFNQLKDRTKELISTIQELSQQKKLLLALDIIKNKNVDIIAIKNLDNAWQYNTSERCRKPFIKILTDEEFYLLKEILL